MQYYDQFVSRHIGIGEADLSEMLKVIKAKSLDQLIEETVPATIRINRELDLPDALSEYEYLQELKKTAAKNKEFQSFIGMGYHGTITPAVILRNIFQNPGWYTQYTPYQAEIAQGRLEALLNFQTAVSDLTGMPIANASLLDEGTAAAEAMAMFYSLKNKRNKGAAINQFFVENGVMPQTVDVLKTRAEPLGIQLIRGDWKTFQPSDKTFGVLLQYPAQTGAVEDYKAFAASIKSQDIYLTVAADILSLALLTPPGEWGADAVVGNTQRFGVPMGYGGPHAAYFATKEDYKRQIPGRIIGVSIDRLGKPALRMALQTREQHIRREKATSNICTAQALLAIMAGMYAVYHGAAGVRAIAQRTHQAAMMLDAYLTSMGYQQKNEYYFDTLSISVDTATKKTIKRLAVAQQINFYYGADNAIQISLDETISNETLQIIIGIFAKAKNQSPMLMGLEMDEAKIPTNLQRNSKYLSHEVFNAHRSETQMMRYIKSMENKDLSLTHSMIALGSCTMKLNAAAELLPVSWPEFANIHPFAPSNQVKGYQQIFEELEAYLCECTGFAACSLQPNSGAQGEYAGLMTIRAYHKANGDKNRNIALIPASAHGTNPASAVMAGMKVVVTKCDEQGNIDLDDLKSKSNTT